MRCAAAIILIDSLAHASSKGHADFTDELADRLAATLLNEGREVRPFHRAQLDNTVSEKGRGPLAESGADLMERACVHSDHGPRQRAVSLGPCGPIYTPITVQAQACRKGSTASAEGRPRSAGAPGRRLRAGEAEREAHPLAQLCEPWRFPANLDGIASVAMSFRAALSAPTGPVRTISDVEDAMTALTLGVRKALTATRGPSRRDPDVENARELESTKNRRASAGRLTIQPFKSERPLLDRDKAVRRVLDDTGVWRTQRIAGNVAVAEGVMDVKASPSVVWNQLFDFPAYSKKVSPRCRADVYKGKSPSSVSTEPRRSPDWEFPYGLDLQFPYAAQQDTSGALFHARGTRQPAQFGVMFGSKVLPGVEMAMHCNMSYEPAKNSLTWGLDKTMKNSIGDFQGHWYVAPHPSGPARALVFYQLGLTVPRWLPKPVMNRLARTFVKDATFWVKTQSELAVRA